MSPSSLWITGPLGSVETSFTSISSSRPLPASALNVHKSPYPASSIQPLPLHCSDLSKTQVLPWHLLTWNSWRLILILWIHLSTMNKPHYKSRWAHLSRFASIHFPTPISHCSLPVYSVHLPSSILSVLLVPLPGIPLLLCHLSCPF